MPKHGPVRIVVILAIALAQLSPALAESGSGGGGSDDRGFDDRGGGRGGDDRGRGRGGRDDGSSAGHGSVEERAAAIGDVRADRAADRLREDVRGVEFEDRLMAAPGSAVGGPADPDNGRRN